MSSEAMTDTPKLCEDCRHLHGLTMCCGHLAAVHIRAEHERATGTCGPTARYFAPRNQETA
jgi:hypothetical protein